MRGNFTFELAPGVLSRSEQICAGTGAICEQPTTSQVNYCCVVSIAKPQQIFRSYSSKLTTALRFAFVCVNKGCVATLACVASPHVPCLSIYAQAFSCEPWSATPAVMLFCGHREVAMAVGVLLASATLQGCEDTQYATGEEAVEAICGNMRCLDYCRGCVLFFSGNGTEEELLKHSHLYSCGYPEKPENPCKVWDTWS